MLPQSFLRLPFQWKIIWNIATAECIVKVHAIGFQLAFTPQHCVDVEGTEPGLPRKPSTANLYGLAPCRAAPHLAGDDQLLTCGPPPLMCFLQVVLPQHSQLHKNDVSGGFWDLEDSWPQGTLWCPWWLLGSCLWLLSGPHNIKNLGVGVCFSAAACLIPMLMASAMGFSSWCAGRDLEPLDRSSRYPLT